MLCREMLIIKKLSLIMTSSWRHECTFITHLEVVIDCAKFDDCTSSIFGGVKTYVQNRALYVKFTFNQAGACDQCSNCWQQTLVLNFRIFLRAFITNKKQEDPHNHLLSLKITTVITEIDGRFS